MALSLLESLRRLIRQDLTDIDAPVGNFHGAVAGTLELTESTPTQSWLMLQVNGNQVLSQADFFQDYDVASVNSTSVVAATSGVATIEIPAGRVALLRSVVSVSRAQTANLTVALGQNSTAVVYLDGVLQRTVNGTTTTASYVVPISLTPGQHTIALVVQASTVTITLPSNLALSGLIEQITTPQWRQVTTGYLDAQNGTVVNTLEWVSDAQVGGYRVLRRTIKSIGDVSVVGDGEVLAVSTLDASNRFTLTLRNDHTDVLTPGMPLLLNGVTIGVVVNAVLDDTGDTTVLCRLPVNLTQPDTSIVGQYCYTGQLLEIARVAPQNTAAVVTYQDSAVTFGTEYEYALQAVGLLDQSVFSQVSDRIFVRAGDTGAPGTITLASGYPKVLNRQATVRFTTPADTDYQGVRVYARAAATNNGTPFTVASISSLTVTIQGAVALPASLTGYRVKFGANAAVYEVNQRTGSYTFTLFQDPGVITAGTTITLYKDTLVKTDYGSPNRLDELTFDLTTYGEYYFASFDRSNNEQGYSAAVKWTYSTAADTFSGPPVLAVRQLSESEQANFAGYTDTITYAIVEIYAYDPQQVAATPTSGVTLFYQKEGEVTRSLTPVSGTFPTTISGAQTIDNPSGTRTRYIAINRSAPTLRIWATNALNLRSEDTTYVADHDTIPKVTSLETSINPSEDTVTFAAVVDDDTICIEWTVDGGAATLISTASSKRVGNNPVTTPIALALGQLRVLTVTPYSKDVTGFSSLQKQAVAGPAVTRELVRTPRSFVRVEDKDQFGVRSAEWATLNFSMSPNPQALVTGRTGTVSVASGVWTITDGTATWTTNQYKSGLTAAFFAKVTVSGQAPVVRRIVENTATALKLEGQLPVSTGSVSFEIWNGAVFVRKAVTGNETFEPTVGSELAQRDPSATIRYEFYGHFNGCYRESTRSIIIDPDTLPSLTNFRYDYNSATQTLTVLFDSADDDSTYWDVYERKGGWPNSTSATPGTAPTSVAQLLPQYLRFSDGVERTSYARKVDSANAGTWYAVAVPKNSFGEAGTLSTASINLVTPPAPQAQLTDLTLTPNQGTTNLTITPTTANAAGGNTINYTAVRLDDAATTTSFSSTVGAGAYVFNIGETIVASNTVGAVTRDWQVTATLSVAGGNTLTRVAKFKTQPPASTVTLSSVLATVTDQGVCYQDSCWSPNSSPHRRQVQWTVQINGVNATASSPYYVNIEVATDAPGTDYSPLVYGIPAYAGSYLDETSCYYEVVSGGFNVYWKYRVTVVDSSGNALSPSVNATTSQLTRMVKWCNGEVF